MTAHQWARKAATDYCGGEPCKKVACMKTVEEIVELAVSNGRVACAKFAAKQSANLAAIRLAVADDATVGVDDDPNGMSLDELHAELHHLRNMTRRIQRLVGIKDLNA